MKKILVGLMTLLITFTLFVLDNKAFAEEWIDISTPEELNAIRENLNANYRLVNDIDMSDWGEWEPIGTGLTNNFHGVLDGQGYEIKNFNSNTGLFGNIGHSTNPDFGAEIRNLGIVDAHINSTSPLAGILSNTIGRNVKISNVYVTGEIIGGSGSSPTGGIAGMLHAGSEVTNSYANVKINSGGNRVGGLFGEVRGASGYPVTIKYSYALGEVVGTNNTGRAGGLIGATTNSTNGTTIVEDSYARVNVTGSNYGGSFIGSTGSDTTVKNTYFSGATNRPYGFLGPGTRLEVISSYWDLDVTGNDRSEAGEGKTTEEMFQKATYEGWDFENVWDIEEGKGYPFLRNMPQGDQSTDGAGGDNGNGSGDDNGEDDNTGNDDGSTGGSNEDSGDDEASVGIGDGGLKLTTSPIIHFGNHNITNEIKTIYTSFERAIKVEDLRGTHEGWRLDVSATPFKVAKPAGGFKEGTTAHELPKGSFAILPPSKIERVGNGSSELPTSEINSKTVIDNGTVTIANAEKGTGTGEFDIVFPENALSLVIDPETVFVDKINYPNTYTPYKSTLTWNLVSAP